MSDNSQSIAKGSVVSIHYTLRDDAGTQVDSSAGGEPLAYLHGYGQIIPGLEKALTGKVVGDKFNVTVAPSEGYGEYEKDLEISLERAQFPQGAKLEVGMMFELSGPQNESFVVRVTKLGDTKIDVNGNHPLAGKKLHFEGSVVSIREATADEKSHGHAHGPGGHHHH